MKGRTKRKNKNDNEEEEEINDDDEMKAYNIELKNPNDDLLREVNIENREKFTEALNKEYKRKKTIRDRMFLELKRSRSKRKESSGIQKFLNIIHKKNAKSNDEIIGALSAAGYSTDEKTRKLLQVLSSVKVVNNKVTFSTQIMNMPLYTYYTCTFPNVKSLTNDILYLWSVLSSTLSSDGKKNLLNITKTASFVDVMVVSQLTDQEGDVFRGYYQDYDGDFCAVNINNLSLPERNKILNLEGNSFEFMFHEKEYVAVGNTIACIIFRKGLSKEEVNNLYNNMKIIRVDNKKIELKQKTVKIQNKPKFISCRLKGESFCPCFMILPSGIAMNMLYKIQIDNNYLFNFFDEQCKTSKISVGGLPNLLYWNTLESFFDFIQIYLLTSESINEATRLLFKESIELYYKLKPALLLWKNNQLEYQRILYDFYNSFTSKIKYDKLMIIRAKNKKFLENKSFLVQDSTYTELQDLFVKLKAFSSYINNQFDSSVMYIANKIDELLDEIHNGTFDSIDDLKKIGIMIYRVSSIKENDNSFPSFPFILSPGGFLGNTVGGVFDDNNTTLAEMIETFKNVRKKVDQKDKDMRKNVLTLLNSNQQRQEEVIKNAFIEKFKETGLSFDKQAQNVLTTVINSALKSKKVKNEINNAIVNEDILNKKIVNDELIELNKIITNNLDIYLQKIENKKLELQANLNKNKNLINNIKMENNKISDAMQNMNLSEKSEGGQEESEDSIKTEVKKNSKKKKKKAKKNEFYEFSEINKVDDVSRFSGLTNIINTKQAINSVNPSEIFTNLKKINENKTIEQFITENNEKLPIKVHNVLKDYYLRAAANSGEVDNINIRNEKSDEETLFDKIEKYPVSDDAIDETFRDNDLDLKEIINNYTFGITKSVPELPIKKKKGKK